MPNLQMIDKIYIVQPFLLQTNRIRYRIFCEI